MGNKKMGSFSYYASNFPWIHLRSDEEKIDFFIFAWGVTRPISSICSEILSSVSSDDHNIPTHLRMVPQNHAVIFGGNKKLKSEKSHWKYLIDVIYSLFFLRSFGRSRLGNMFKYVFQAKTSCNQSFSCHWYGYFSRRFANIFR